MGRLKITRLCKSCNQPFHPWSGNHPNMFCSNKCRSRGQFWANVSKTDNCWIWVGSCDRDGYGNFSRIQRAHRYSWILHFGPIIPVTLWVLHKCDNPPCVRPDHLYLGTNIENVRDRTQRGRQRGEGHGMAIITENEVKEIRNRYATERISQIKLGAQYGLSQTAISQIVLKKCWKHIE